MRVQAYIFYGCGVFFLITDVVYWLLSKDWTGTTALGMSVGLSFMIGFYVHFTVNRLEKLKGNSLPEDNKTGEIAELAGKVGEFSPHSWWPLFVGLSAAGTCLGLVFGWWLVFLSAACLVLAVIGLVFEYYRGQYVEV